MDLQLNYGIMKQEIPNTLIAMLKQVGLLDMALLHIL